MKKIKAKLDFVSFPVNDKIEFYKNVAVQLANTLVFPAPEVPLATIKTVVDNFEAAILAAKDGAHSAIAVRNDKEELADELFRVLVIYVNKVANGDETVIIKSGFNATKQPTPFQKPEIAVNDAEHSGSVVVIKAVLGAAAYKIQYKKESVVGQISEWIEAEISPIATCLIENLMPGALYYFRFASISSAGTTDFCDPISKIVI